MGQIIPYLVKKFHTRKAEAVLQVGDWVIKPRVMHFIPSTSSHSQTSRQSIFPPHPYPPPLPIPLPETGEMTVKLLTV